MKKYRFIIILSIIVLAVSLLAINSGSESQEEYVAGIKREREEKDNLMRTSADSPFKNQAFDSLKYYPIHHAYKVMAKVIHLEQKEPIVLGTSDNKKRQYQKFAKVEFELKGKRHQLTLLRRAEQGMQNITFLAFTDSTSGETTYGGGRYLDVSVKNARQITLDFNKAYNPYCNYNPAYSCPLPLRENTLQVAIEAGEKSYTTAAY